MTREIRHIFLNKNELVHALDEYRTAHGDFLPPGQIVHVAAAADRITTKIDMRYDENRHVLDFMVSYDKLRDVLIQYCLEHQIRLPMAGLKRARDARADDEEVCLEVVLGRDESLETAQARLQPEPRRGRPPLGVVGAPDTVVP